MKKKGPVPIGNIVAEILTQRGLGRPQATIELETIWSEVVGPSVVQMTHCGQIRRQQLSVTVTNSTIMQELSFRKQEIIKQLNKKLPSHGIKDIRFRIGNIRHP